MKCIYCSNEKLYELKSGHLKCSKCKKKFSPKKVKTDLKLIDFFCNNLTINKTKKELDINYITIKKRYDLFRQLIASFLENEYKHKRVIEYNEYIYLAKSKKKIKENIFDAQNFLTFHYDNRVYNLLMPNLNRYKKEFIDDGAQEVYFKEFSKFMMFNKISKTTRRGDLISRFWLFFEESILKYKGIRNDNFFYYLKEIEFKFSYAEDKQREILIKLLYKFL